MTPVSRKHCEALFAGLGITSPRSAISLGAFGSLEHTQAQQRLHDGYPAESPL
jgi:hypothetical protein